MFSNHRADYRAMINSARWVELRAQVLSTRPLCARCMHEGRETLELKCTTSRPWKTARQPKTAAV